MSNHTQGPWEVVEDEYSGRYIVGGDRVYVATVEHERQPGRMAYRAPRAAAPSNAHMIAAAPDMAAVCLELRRLMLVIESSVRNISPEHSDAINALLHRNNAAIAKGLPK